MSVVRHTGYNLASALVPVAVSLATVPVYIHTIGEARYGVLALIGVLLGYFGVFDLGLSTATAQRIAASDPRDHTARAELVWTASAVNLALGLAGAVLIVPAGWLFAHAWITAPGALSGETGAAIGWLALALPVSLLSGVLRGALQGAERFAELNLINALLSPVSQLVPLGAALWISPSLTVVLPALYATRALALAALAWVIAARVTHGWAPAFARARVADLLRFGGWVTVSSLIAPLMTALDRLLIGALLGARTVSHYTVPYQLAERTLVLPGALLQALFPRISAARDDAAAVRLSVRGMRAIAAVFTAPTVAGVVFLHPFLAWWIGRDFADAAARCGQILLCGFWWNALGMACVVRLQSADRPRLIAAAHAIELLPYLAVLALAMHWFGLVGAALAFALRVIADDLLLAAFGNLLGEMARLSTLAVLAFAPALWCGADPWGARGAAGLALVALVGAASLAWLAGERASLRAAFVPSRA